MRSLTVRSVFRQTEQLYHVEMAEIVPEYRHPGQYAIVVDSGIDAEKKAYYAFSSLPGEPVSFLLKDVGAASSLCHAAPGYTVHLQAVEGSGFQIDDVTGPMLLFSMGSGIGPFRPLIRALLSSQTRKNGLHIELWQGSFTEADVPYRSEIDAWQRQGLRFIGCYDREGLMQNAVERLQQAAPDLSDATVFWVGSPEFGESLRKVALPLGLRPECFRSNFG